MIRRSSGIRWRSGLALATLLALAIGLLWLSGGGAAAEAASGRFSQVSAGGAHSCALRTDGGVICWGYNYSGQGGSAGGTLQPGQRGRGHPYLRAADGRRPGLLGVERKRARRRRRRAASARSALAETRIARSAWTDAWSVGGITNTAKRRRRRGASARSARAGIILARCERTDDRMVCWGAMTGPARRMAPSGRFSRVSAGASHSCALRAGGGM